CDVSVFLFFVTERSSIISSHFMWRQTPQVLLMGEADKPFCKMFSPLFYISMMRACFLSLLISVCCLFEGCFVIKCGN
ncbi:hypothetical protein VU12_14025, partial [Desulfobulbus sp. US4]|nr:hypothetical protein [Desulfobulbus sp. US4]